MINNNINHLFITYDGLMDPLGKSQIVPYLGSISNSQRIINVISFEKINNIKYQKVKTIERDLLKKNIVWKFSMFSRNFGKLGKIYDLIKMFYISLLLVKKKKIQVVHCRSHIPALVGFLLKKIFNIKLIFDFRGLWIEERFDYKIWNKNNYLNSLIYKFFKNLEFNILNKSDFIVCLTYAIKPYLRKIVKNKVPVEIIPCCADYNFFKKKKYSKNRAKKALSINKNVIVIGYSGSINEVYLIKKMIKFYIFLNKINKNIIFIFVTHQIKELNNLINKNFDNNIKNKIKIYKSDRKKIPFYLSSFDLMISFIKNTFSRKAMSPTKMFEAFAMGIPFFCNKGIGDVDFILEKNKTGAVTNLNDNFNEKHFKLFMRCTKIKPNYIINKTKPLYDISFAKERYNYIYDYLENEYKR